MFHLLRSRLPTLAFTALAAAWHPAQAVYLVDTGAPVNPPFSSGLGANPGGNLSLAVAFGLGSAATVGSVEGWMTVMGTGTLTATLYSGSPTGAQLFTASATRGPAPGFVAGWTGLDGLNWSVGPGTYVLAFSSPDGFMASMPVGAPNPLGAEWSRFGNFNWASNDGLNLGVRVADAPAANVPEPAGWALLLAGAALLGPALARRRPAAQHRA